MSLAALRTCDPLTVRVDRRLNLLDLRPHAYSFPVLQSERYTETRELAESARIEGFEGIVYRSAQQYGAGCYAIFGDDLKALRKVSRDQPVTTDTDRLHRALDAAGAGPRLALTP